MKDIVDDAMSDTEAEHMPTSMTMVDVSLVMISLRVRLEETSGGMYCLLIASAVCSLTTNKWWYVLLLMFPLSAEEWRLFF